MDENPEKKPDQAGDAREEQAPSQDPIEKELAKVHEKKTKMTRAERLRFEQSKIAEQLRDLGEEGETPSSTDDSAPVTIGMLKEREKDQAQKTALHMAEEIADEKERELTIVYLKERVRPSGNPTEDLRLAKQMVNAVKNQQILEEIARKGTANARPTGSGAPAPTPDGMFEPDANEAMLMKPPYNLSKEQVIEARRRAETK